MARKSSIDLLPPDILEKFLDLLRDQRLTDSKVVSEINDVLENHGHDMRLSRSATNRYRSRMEKVGSRLKERHEIANLWIGKFGHMPQGKLGQLMIQMVQGLAFEASLKFEELENVDIEDMPALVKMLKELSMTIQRTEKAASLNATREREVRKQLAEEAAEAAAETARSDGVSPETIERIRRDVLRMAE